MSTRNTVRVASGFTLIELIIVLAISGIIAGLATVSLQGFSEKQKLTEATKTFYAAVQLARSRTQTQVKPRDCVDTAPLEGYQVNLTCPQTGCTGYSITPICGGLPSQTVTKGTFPVGIVVRATNQTFQFKTITGNVTGFPSSSTDITFTSRNGTTKSVTIFTDGRVEHNADK